MVGMSAPMARLQRALRGPVLVPDHPAYNVARTTFDAMTDRHPAVIACCAGSDDVAAAVGWAQTRVSRRRSAAAGTAWPVTRSAKAAW
jgi:hypothetical protein